MVEILQFPVRAARVREAPLHFDVVADPAQLAALAELFGLPALRGLRGGFDLVHVGGGVIDAALHLTAALTQICVVTLDPFDSDIDERARLRFLPSAQITEGSELAELTAETLQGPDEIPYGGETIDLGAALAEQLALGLEPYPRRPGVALPAAASADPADDPAHPFAGLAGRMTGGRSD